MTSTTSSTCSSVISGKTGREKQFPDGTNEEIEDAIGYNSLRRWFGGGKDCIETHNLIVQELHNQPKMRLGTSSFDSADKLDEALEAYVRERQGVRKKGEYEYPAIIQIYQIYPDAK